MKKLTKILVILSLILSSAQLFSQTESAVVSSLDKNNVFYIGIDNPLNVSVPGVANDKLRVSIKNGTLIKNGDKYTVIVSKVGEAIINVATEVNSGVIKSAGSYPFKIKKMPEPRAYFGNHVIKDSLLIISKEEVLADPTINASIDLPFDYDLVVIEFAVSYKLNDDFITESTTGNTLSKSQISAIKQSAVHKVFIEDIKVKCPDSTVRTLSAVIVKFIDKK